MLEKILGFILLRRTMSASTSLIESLLVGMAVISILALMAGILLAVLITGGIYVSYNALLAHGVLPITASLMVGGLILALLAITIIIAIFCVLRIKTIPKNLISKESKIAECINKAIDEFIAGFNAEPTGK